MKKWIVAVCLLLTSGCAITDLRPTRARYNYEKIEKFELLDEFEKLSIDSEFCDVKVRSGDTFEIQTIFYGEKWQPHYHVEEQTLMVEVVDEMPEAVSWNANQDNQILITIPADNILKNVTAEVDYGAFFMNDLSIENIETTLQYTDYEFSDMQIDTYQFDFAYSDGNFDDSQMTSGDLKVDFSNVEFDAMAVTTMNTENHYSTLSADHFEADTFTHWSEFGDVDIKNAIIQVMDCQSQYGDCLYEGSIEQSAAFKNEYGTVALELDQPQEVFTFDLGMMMGDVSLNRDIYESDEQIGTGEVLITMDLSFADGSINTHK